MCGEIYRSTEFTKRVKMWNRAINSPYIHKLD